MRGLPGEMGHTAGAERALGHSKCACRFLHSSSAVQQQFLLGAVNVCFRYLAASVSSCLCQAVDTGVL